MAKTYEPIASFTVSTPAALFEFTSIPSTFTDLVLIIHEPSIASGGSNANVIQFNQDSGSNYSGTRLRGNGSTASASRVSNDNGIETGGGIAGATAIVNIFNYSNTNVYKTTLSGFWQMASGNQSVVRSAGLWRNTSAINRISMDTRGSIYSYFWSTGTTFSLFGIKAAA